MSDSYVPMPVPPPPSRWHKAGLIVAGLGLVLLLGVLFVGCSIILGCDASGQCFP